MNKSYDKLFYIDDYINDFATTKNKVNIINKNDTISDKEIGFINLCKAVRDFFDAEWEQEQSNKPEKEKSILLLETQKKAIIGHLKEVNYFKDKIYDYLKQNNLLDSWYPDWYRDLPEAIFHENWGLAGIAPWKYLDNSSSAKIIGDRIYFLIDGKQVLQPQRITKERFEQLRKALLLRTPKKRSNEPYSEVYMLSGERISIYHGDLTKEDQDVIVFRKYIVDNYTFEEQANRNTIPKEAINFFKAFSQVGFNVNFVGPVRSAKTTMLTTWQSYENPTLEGVLVETDPEIPLHKIMPDSPIMQIVADGEELSNITKSLMRSDADYLIMAEARDGISLNIAVELANRGTKRCKSTTHLSVVDDFCYDVANKIVASIGGNLEYTILKVAKSFNYVIEMTQLSSKKEKRVKGIYEIRYDPINYKISYHQICKYHYDTDTWSFKYDIGPDKRNIAIEENYNAFKIFDSELKRLSELYPMKDNHIIVPYYGVKTGVKAGDNNA